jgi:ABC-type sugar transport system substrate-binding protein
LLCGNDNMAIGAVSAIKAAGKTGKVLVVGYDNINAIKPMLADGRVLATADQFGSQQAVFGIETVLKARRRRSKPIWVASSKPRSNWSPRTPSPDRLIPPGPAPSPQCGRRPRRLFPRSFIMPTDIPRRPRPPFLY